MKKLGIFVCMLAIVTLFAACGDTHAENGFRRDNCAFGFGECG